MSNNPFPINPGGSLPDAAIVGREYLAKRLLERLQIQSIVLVAERRIGKTHVLRKIERLKAANQTVIQRDLESIHSAEEFVEYVFSDIAQHHTSGAKFVQSFTELRKGLGGIDIKVMGNGIKLPEISKKHWKQILQDGIALAFKGLAEDQQLVFLWDELPMMLQNIAGTGGKEGATQGNPKEAMELLNVLRELRQKNKNLRMVFTGSIGLHHVIQDLKAKGYANAPINDMLSEEVPPLSIADAATLATKLIESNNIPVSAEQTLTDLALHIAEHVDGVGFYVHHVCAKLEKAFTQNSAPQGTGANRALVDRIISHATKLDGHDEWELAHYRDRTQTYYGEHQAHCLSLLDAIASAENGMSTTKLLNIAKTAHTALNALDKDQWLTLIERLQKDFYVVRDEATGELRFKFKLVLAWWRAHRDIQVQGA